MNPQEATQNTPVLEIRNLVKDYRTIRAVDNLSFQVKQGCVTGLLGPNGAGKTTTFNIICRFLKATAGQVLVEGVPLDRFTQLKGRIQALPQDAQLPESIPILRQLTFYAQLQGMSRTEAHEEATKALKQVGLGEKLNDRAGALSHGMHQRAAMAQAFLGKPELILLDEPTSGLDPRRASEARDLITELKGETSVLISSHNLSEIQSICDEVVIIHQGKLVYQGSMDELTGQAAEFTVSLRTDTPVDIATIGELPDVAKAEHNTEEQTIKITCEQNADDGAVVSLVLRHLLDAGHLVIDLQRGSSLEDRFLHLTDEAESDEAESTE